MYEKADPGELGCQKPWERRGELEQLVSKLSGSHKNSKNWGYRKGEGGGESKRLLKVWKN